MTTGDGGRDAESAAIARLADAVRAKARELGFGLVGITGPEPSAHMASYRRWIAEGRHGGMAYLARPDAVARRGDLGLTLPGVRSVIVVGHEYYQEDPPGVPDDPSRGVIARYARGRDYHKVVKRKLTVLGRWLETMATGGADVGASSAGVPPGAAPASPAPSVSWRAYVDTGPILERDLGQRAGLGWLGKNTILINPGKGSYFFLGVLLTDVPLEPDEPFAADFCGTCTACLDACPTGALLGRDEDGAPVLDATRCISYLTIEHRGTIPAGLAARMGNRIYGCDICQEVCPWNRRFAEVAAERGYAAREAWEAEWDEEDVSAETCRGSGACPRGKDAGGANAGDANAGDVSAETSDGADAAVTAAAGAASDGDEPDDDEPGDDEPGGDGPSGALIPTTDGPALIGLMHLSEDEWDAYTRGSAMRRAGYAGLRRNVAIALGNWLAVSDAPHPDAVGELLAALSDEDGRVAEAAAWGLKRMRARP